MLNMYEASLSVVSSCFVRRVNLADFNFVEAVLLRGFLVSEEHDALRVCPFPPGRTRCCLEMEASDNQ
uniref:Uncharacterized protein n=1 Tax=Anguilla anguilla TaxID=7936 RepID=A0A0E9SP82_ANGAN